MTAISPRQLARWRRDPSAFVEEVLHDPETGKPFKLLPAERAFMERAFTFDNDGRLVYTEWLYAAAKKSGKTGFGALLLLTTVLLYGGRFGEAYTLANDLEQAQSRVYAAVAKIVACSPLLKDADVGRDKITFPAFDNATVQSLANDYAGAAGSNPTISVFDELWGFMSERSQRLWDEMTPPPTRKVACRLTVTYAGFEGESALLEGLYKRGLQQSKVGKDLYAGDGLLMFWTHEPVAPWQTESWLDQMRRTMRPLAFARMILNQFVHSESAFIDLDKWDRCVDLSARPVVADKSMPIWVGIDASVKHDSTAIVAVTYDEAQKKVRLVFHRVFQPNPNQPLDFEQAIEATVHELHDRFNLRRALFDPYQMQATAQRIRAGGINIEEFPQSTPNLTAASQNLFDLVNGNNLIVYRDDAMRLAVSHAVAVETSRGWRITKEKAAHKIDTIVALGMACFAAVEATGTKPRRAAFAVSVSGGMPGYDDNGMASLRAFGGFLRPEERHDLADAIGISHEAADEIAAMGAVDVNDAVEYQLSAAEVERNRMRERALGPDWRSKVARPTVRL